MSGKIISVYSSKGGVGKTVIATFLSSAFRLYTERKILLVDFGYPFSNDIYKLLKINNKQYYKRLSKYINIDPDSLLFKSIRSYAYFHDLTEIYILSLSESDENIHLLTPSSIEYMLKQLQRAYDYIILDIGMLINSIVERILDLSGIILIPFINDYLAIDKTINDLLLLRSKNYPFQKIEVVENMYQSNSSINQYSSMKMKELIKLKSIFSKISYNESFYSKMNEDGKYFSNYPDDHFTKSFDALFSKTYNHTALINSRDKEVEDDTFDIDKFKLSITKELQDALDKIDEKIDEEFDKRAIIEISRIIDETSSIKSRKLRTRLVKELFQEKLKLGPIEDLLDDPSISEIMVNSFDKIYVERKGIIELTDKKFLSESSLQKVIETIVGKVNRKIDKKSPMVDARLEKDGSRVNAVIKPISVKGPVLTIRKFTKEYVNIQSLIKNNSMNLQIADFLKAAVKAKLNILISGSTGSGKTTLLNILSEYISIEERIVTIEDSAELNLKHPHVVTLETKPQTPDDKNEITIRDIVKNALRMRPDRIIVGECRGGEALDMLQAMGTGHSGSMTSIHANSTRDALSRIETLVMFVGSELSSKAIKDQIVAAIDIIVQIKRFKDGSRKIVQVSEVTGIEDDFISTGDIFIYKQTGEKFDKTFGDFVATGNPPKCWNIFREKNIDIDKEIFWKS